MKIRIRDLSSACSLLNRKQWLMLDEAEQGDRHFISDSHQSAGTRVFWPLSATFPGALAGSSTGSGCWLCRKELYLLWHNPGVSADCWQTHQEHLKGKEGFSTYGRVRDADRIMKLALYLIQKINMKWIRDFILRNRTKHIWNLAKPWITVVS